MLPFVDTWLIGSPTEAVKLMRLRLYTDDLQQWGTGVGLGWTPTLRVQRKGTTVLIATLTGRWSDASQFEALFDIGAATALLPANAGDSIDYESFCVPVRAGYASYVGADGSAQPVEFRVTKAAA